MTSGLTPSTGQAKFPHLGALKAAWEHPCNLHCKNPDDIIPFCHRVFWPWLTPGAPMACSVFQYREPRNNKCFSCCYKYLVTASISLSTNTSSSPLLLGMRAAFKPDLDCASLVWLGAKVHNMLYALNQRPIYNAVSPRTSLHDSNIQEVDIGLIR